MENISALLKDYSRINTILGDLEENKNTIIDKLHKAILDDILKKGLLAKMNWYVPACTYNYIDRIQADKDSGWDEIVQMMDQCSEMSYASREVSLTDDIVLRIDNTVVNLCPVERRTKVSRELEKRTGVAAARYMTECLFEFSKANNLKVDFTIVVSQKYKLEDELNFVNEMIAFGSKLNEEK